MNKTSSVVDLLEKAKSLSGNYENVILAEVNDHVVRVSMMTEAYFWHMHPESDEVFLGVEGTVVLELADERIELGPGQMFTVPKGIKHRTSPAGPRSVNITIESKVMTTVRVDE